MGRLFAATGLIGIGSITAIAYRLAELRMIDVCGWSPMLRDPDCVGRLERQRDAVLIYGLSFALAFILICLLIYAPRLPLRRFGGFSGFRSANRAARSLPRA